MLPPSRPAALRQRGLSRHLQRWPRRGPGLTPGTAAAPGSPTTRASGSMQFSSACNSCHEQLAIGFWRAESSEALPVPHYPTGGSASSSSAEIVEPGRPQDVLETAVALVTGVLVHGPLRRQIEDGCPRAFERAGVVDGHFVADLVGGRSRVAF